LFLWIEIILCFYERKVWRYRRGNQKKDIQYNGRM